MGLRGSEVLKRPYLPIKSGTHMDILTLVPNLPKFKGIFFLFFFKVYQYFFSSNPTVSSIQMSKKPPNTGGI